MTVLIDKEVADLFRALGHPTRIAMVKELLKGYKCVGDISGFVHAKQPNISQHLAILKAAGIVNFRQEGRLKCYSLNNPKLIRIVVEAAEEFSK